MSNKIELEYDLSEIRTVAEQFLDMTKEYKVFAFSGELGAGKTTFISAVCKALDVAEIVSSPTFSIVQEYKSQGGNDIFHLDLYRIKDEEDAVHSGLEEYLRGDHYCFVEWPENAPGIFPSDTVSVSIDLINPSKRKMMIELPK